MFFAQELRGRNLNYRPDEYSLTFDDGPSEGITPELARWLCHEGIAATFFVLGEHSNQPALAALIQQGHRLGNHTFSHQNLDRFQGDQCAELGRQIVACHELIKRFAVQTRIPFRAPGGAWSNPRFSRFANGLPIAKRYIGRYGWDLDGDDWRLLRRRGHPEKFQFEHFRQRFEHSLTGFRGGIVLLHDGYPSNEAHLIDPNENQVLDVARYVLAAMRSRGFRCVPLREPPVWREWRAAVTRCLTAS